MSAPAIGGVQVSRGNGATIRLPRGASLADFADRIGANPAALVQIMLHLGEMVTATQSVNEETLQLLGAELDYNIQVVSRRRRTASFSRPSTSSSARTRAMRPTWPRVRRS